MHYTDIVEVKSARKTHDCDWCAETIEPQSGYRRWRCYDGGDATTMKVHPECYEAMNRAMGQDSEILFSPGENPRGCDCGFHRDCERCSALAEGGDDGSGR